MPTAGGDFHCVPGTARVDKKAPCRRQAAGGDCPTSPKQPVSSQRPEDIPIASPKQPVSSKRPRAEDKECGLPSKKKNKDEGQSSGVMVRFIQPSHPNIPTGVTTPQPIPTSGELSESTGAIFVEDLNGTSNEDSVAKPPNVINSRLLPYVQARIQRHIAATDMWKKAYEVELSKDEVSTCKYTQEQALQGQKSARAKLLEVKKELRMLQVLHQDVDEGNAASAP
ncbi:hypothetical protein R1flu_001138 [Riccia fluitans]|uniref:Uncharacterized protein n=1 Tax=Riccia fluitans TaxID=41844 RepID=A0ABD1Y2G0_9MARC